MISPTIAIRQSKTTDYEKIVRYFLDADRLFLIGMGVDVLKLPNKQDWLKLLYANHALAIPAKQFYHLIWLINNQPIGHSNINKIVFAREAYMHLHIWNDLSRQKGIGFALLKQTIPHYFNVFKLEQLFCEPAATNTAPNKTLEKLGFDFVQTYDTVPGWINTYQTVNRWVITKEKFKSLF